MGRRFSDEPINVIRRIPTPEQLDAARPVKRSFGEKFGEAAASFARSVVGRLAPGTGPKPEGTALESDRPPQEEPGDVPNEVVAAEQDALLQEAATEETPRPSTAEPHDAEPIPCPAPSSPTASSSVLPEELAEVRGYLLKQQQDIVRLAAQIQELKALVISQQRLIEYLGKEADAGSVSLLTAGITSAVAKRNRAARPKPVMKGKAVVSNGDPMRLPLNV
jgi:hypothetical protein